MSLPNQSERKKSNSSLSYAYTYVQSNTIVLTMEWNSRMEKKKQQKTYCSKSPVSLLFSTSNGKFCSGDSNDFHYLLFLFIKCKRSCVHQRQRRTKIIMSNREEKKKHSKKKVHSTRVQRQREHKNNSRKVIRGVAFVKKCFE